MPSCQFVSQDNGCEEHDHVWTVHAVDSPYIHASGTVNSLNRLLMFDLHCLPQYGVETKRRDFNVAEIDGLYLYWIGTIPGQ